MVWRVKYAARELFSRKLAEFIGNSIDRARDRKEIQRAKLAVERRGGYGGRHDAGVLAARSGEHYHRTRVKTITVFNIHFVRRLEY